MIEHPRREIQGLLPQFFAFVARAPDSSRPALPVSLCPPSSLVTTNDGLDLHLSSRSPTGYKGVSEVKGRRLASPYRAKAPDGSLLGYFATPLEAAVSYARHVIATRSLAVTVNSAVSEQTPQRPDIATEAILPSGESIRLHLSSRAASGYRGVTRSPSRHRTSAPFMARLGPSTADWFGYHASAVSAAIAVAVALQGRDFPASTILDDPSSDDVGLGPLVNPEDDLTGNGQLESLELENDLLDGLELESLGLGNDLLDGLELESLGLYLHDMTDVR